MTGRPEDPLAPPGFPNSIYRGIYEQATDGLFILDSTGQVYDVNPRGCELLGLTRENILQAKLRDLIPPGTRTFRTQEGRTLTLETSPTPLLNDFGLVTLRETIPSPENRYADLFNSLDAIVWEADARCSKFSFVSEQAERLLGYPREAWLKDERFWPEHMHPDDREWAINYCREATLSGQDHEFEYRMIARDGRTVWLRDIVSVVVENNQPVKLRGIMIDISQRIQVEADLEDAIRQHREMLENIQLAALELDLQGRITYCNKFLQNLLGLRLDELIGKVWFDAIVVEAEQQACRQNFSKMLRGEHPTNNAERSVRTRSGETRIMLWSSTLIRDRDGAIIGTASIGEDITDKKRAENILRARYRLVEFAATHSLDELLQATLDEIETLTGSTIGFYHFVDPNQKALTLQNWSTNTLKNMCTADGKYRHYDIKDAGVWVDCVRERKSIIHNDYMSLPHRRGLPEGHAPVQREMVVPVFRGNRIMAIIGTGNKPSDYGPKDLEIITLLADLSWDITERKRAEQELKTSETNLQSLIENFDGLIWAVDHEYRLIVGNSAYLQSTEKMLGRKLLPGESVLGLGIDPQYDTEWKAYFDRALQGETFDLELKSFQTQPTRYFEYRFNPIHSIDGAITGVTVFGRDITTSKQAAADLHTANERLLESVETLQRQRREILRINEMGDMLQICQTPYEAHHLISLAMQDLFPGMGGFLAIMDDKKQELSVVQAWGIGKAPKLFHVDDCWALRRGRIHRVDQSRHDPYCAHMGVNASGTSLCLPLIAQGKTMGLLHLETTNASEFPESIPDLLQTVAETIELALANMRLRETLSEQALHDPLTGLYNRRYMEESLARELAQAARDKTPVAVMLLDLDYFKAFNDEHGHGAGDELLRHLGNYLRDNLRLGDIACRYGGEEFVLVLPNSGKDDSFRRAGDLCKQVKRLVFQYEGREVGPISVSIGVAQYPDDGQNVQQMLRLADKAMYLAKSRGRNQAYLASNLPPNSR